MCKCKSRGGLGIGKILDKNNSLLAKWMWRFDNGEHLLRKRVLCAKYGMDIKDLRWEWSSKSSMSSFVKVVHSLLQEGTSSASILESQLQVIIGNGPRARFWDDIRLNSIPLRRACLRIFALANNKDGRNIPLQEYIPDAIAWLNNPNGVFSVGSFRMSIEEDGSSVWTEEKFIWQDGSARGQPGHAGMSGVLRSSDERFIYMFSKYLGIQDSNTAEIMAIHWASEICASNLKLASIGITITSDSKVAVSWVNSGGFCSINHVNLIYNIRRNMSSQGNMVVCFNPSASNAFADMLAKKRSNRDLEILLGEGL
ncbi:hypothetical protein Ddye_014335 [Dipteronia dyeriana]|uniref:RNase H type-1 domain-containing protein n=1 Tax=Dipteronia dyeriana TaxID=168575 RepID=A0AAD9X7Z1_9ROSI|nr:hypothetical protein Ddye_014335 [Dipteronia dyeriana]